MAKGARASSIKTNNAALKKKVFGPVETSRTERLSAKLLELASQPKPEQVKEYVAMDVQESMHDFPSELWPLLIESASYLRSPDCPCRRIQAGRWYSYPNAYSHSWPNINLTLFLQIWMWIRIPQKPRRARSLARAESKRGGVAAKPQLSFRNIRRGTGLASQRGRNETLVQYSNGYNVVMLWGVVS